MNTSKTHHEKGAVTVGCFPRQSRVTVDFYEVNSGAGPRRRRGYSLEEMITGRAVSSRTN